MSRQRRTKYHVRRRMFLNRDPELPAFVIAVVEDTTGHADDDPNQPWRWAAVRLDFGDCYRRVSFDFNMDTREGRAAGLHKIRRISEAVEIFREALEKEASSLDARPAPPPEEEKKD